MVVVEAAAVAVAPHVALGLVVRLGASIVVAVVIESPIHDRRFGVPSLARRL
jgi:hypothetical protein